MNNIEKFRNHSIHSAYVIVVTCHNVIAVHLLVLCCYPSVILTQCHVRASSSLVVVKHQFTKISKT